MLEDHWSAVHTGSSGVIPSSKVNSVIYTPPCQFSAFDPFLPTLAKWHSASSATSLLDGEKCGTCWQAGQPFRESFASCKNGNLNCLWESQDSQQRQTPSPALWWGIPLQGHRLGQLCPSLVGNELNMSQKWALAATKNHISKGVAWRLREVITYGYNICSTPMKLHLKCCEQIWVLIIRGVDKKERIQCKSTTVLEGCRLCQARGDQVFI